LDLLLLTLAKTRRVQQDGIRFQGYRYMDPTLAGYVKEEVVIRYDPVDLAVIRVFHQERFVCRAICQELSGQIVSLKEIEKAISERRKQVRAELSTRAAMVDRFVEKRWSHRVKPASDDFTDKEAVATILRITKGNLRLIERLMMQVEHVLVANQITVVTKEVVETARKNLIIGDD
jgi:Mu transposase, C-terminal